MPGEVTELVVEGDRLVGVRLASGEVVARQALVVASRLSAHGGLLTGLGATLTDLEVNGYRFGNHIAAGPTGATGAPGVYAAGNVTNPQAQLVVSAAAGLTVGAAVNGDLIEEDTAAAVARRRAG